MEVARFLAQNPFALYLVCLGLGLVIGSFLNVVIYRLPIMMERAWRAQCDELFKPANEAAPDTPQTDSGQAAEEAFNLVVPNSRCPHCGHEIRPWENIPLVSYLVLGGRCSACRERISARYPLVETFCGALTVLVAWKFGFSTITLALMFFTWALIAASLIDLDHMLLPDDITLPLLWAGLVVNSFGLITTLPAALWGAVWGYLSLWSVYWGFRLLTGKEGMGYGDFKLLAALGAWLGWQQLPIIILLASLSGAIIGVGVIAAGLRKRENPIPFGPFLAAGGWLCAIWGREIQAAWLGA